MRRPAQGQRAHLAQQQGKLRQISLAADKAVRLRGEISCADLGIGSHRLSEVAPGSPIVSSDALFATEHAIASVYLSRPKYMTLISAHHIWPSRAPGDAVTQ
jgi:hypothetical protein